MVLVYLHIDDHMAHAAGRFQDGDKLGHPSCQGGISNGRTCPRRRYNGVWIGSPAKPPPA